MPERLRPLDLPMTPFAIGGTVAWALIGLGLLPFSDQLSRDGHDSWLKICLAGFVIGVIGIITMVRYDASRRRQRKAAADVLPNRR